MAHNLLLPLDQTQGDQASNYIPLLLVALNVMMLLDYYAKRNFAKYTLLSKIIIDRHVGCKKTETILLVAPPINSHFFCNPRDKLDNDDRVFNYNFRIGKYHINLVTYN